MVAECPSCGSQNGVLLAEGMRLCFDCRKEWNPDLVDWEDIMIDRFSSAETIDVIIAMPNPRPLTRKRPKLKELVDIIPLAISTEDEQLADTIQTLKAQYVGKSVTWHEGDMAGVIYDISEDGIAFINGSDNKPYEIDPEDLDPIAFVPAVIDMDDDTVKALGSAQLTMAGIALRAGLATLAPIGAEHPLLAPPTDWLPTDPEAWPIAEAGVAYAIAMLCYFFSLDREQLEELVSSWSTDTI